MIEFLNGTIQVRAEDLARGLALTPDEIMQGFRSGTITSQCELGSDVDAGRYRLTFFSPKRRLRLIVDARGEILKQTSSDHGRIKVAKPQHTSAAAASVPLNLATPETPK